MSTIENYQQEVEETIEAISDRFCITEEEATRLLVEEALSFKPAEGFTKRILSWLDY